MKTVFFAINTHTKRACILHGFPYWEQVQGAFRCGIRLPDESSANGIGRCTSLKTFIKKANHSKVTILPDDGFPFELTINPYPKGNHRCAVSASIWRSWTGKRFINGIQCQGERFYFLSEKVAA